MGLIYCLEVRRLLKRNSGYVSVGLCCMCFSGAAKQYTVPGNQNPDWMWWSSGDPAAGDNSSHKQRYPWQRKQVTFSFIKKKTQNKIPQGEKKNAKVAILSTTQLIHKSWFSQKALHAMGSLKITVLLCFDFLSVVFRLKGLEQVTKATMLGHLLPVLLTTLMHPNLQTLTLADALMPQLVQLVLYTSQVVNVLLQTFLNGWEFWNNGKTNFLLFFF